VNTPPGIGLSVGASGPTAPIPSTPPLASADTRRVRFYHLAAIALAIFGTLIFVVALFAYYHALHGGGLSPNSEDWGSFGAYLSGLAGTFISLVTLIALALNLEMTARELQDTRRVMQDQASVLQSQALAMGAQSDTAAREALEQTFFRLLLNRQTNIKNCEIKDPVEGYKRGRAAVESVAKTVAQIVMRITPPPGAERPTASATLSVTIDAEMHGRRAQLDPVIGSTMQLLRFAMTMTPTAGLPDYMSIARADFSIADQVLLLYVGLSGYGAHYGAFELIRDSGVLNGLMETSFVISVPQRYIERYRKA